jgi:hypothetical protein
MVLAPSFRAKRALRRSGAVGVGLGGTAVSGGAGEACPASSPLSCLRDSDTTDWS